MIFSLIFFSGLSLTEMAGITADDLVEKLKQILARESVSEEQIMTLVTDGARNERAVGCRADFCEQSYHIWCFNHRLNFFFGCWGWNGWALSCQNIRGRVGVGEGGIINGGGGENETGMWEFSILEMKTQKVGVEEGEEGELRSWEGAQDSGFDERSVFYCY